MNAERKVQFEEKDISDDEETPLLPEVNRLDFLEWLQDFDVKTLISKVWLIESEILRMNYFSRSSFHIGFCLSSG